MNLKNLEIILQNKIRGFSSPKIEYEQYITPPDLAARILYHAFTLGDIAGKRILDMCAGTGTLGIGALLLGAEHVDFIEIDKEASEVLYQNLKSAGISKYASVHLSNALEFNYFTTYDTCIINPPFGIQQKKFTDIMFLQKGIAHSNLVYSVHNGGQANAAYLEKKIDDFGGELLEMHAGRFSLPKMYTFHKKQARSIEVLVLRTRRT